MSEWGESVQGWLARVSPSTATIVPADYSHADDLMLVVNFHTAFVDSGSHLVFEKLACDRACKDKVERFFDRAFAVEVFVERVTVGTLATEEGFSDYYRARIAAAGGVGAANE